MPKRKHPEEKPEEQFKRFQKTAKEHEVDESGDALERAFSEVAKPRVKPRKVAQKGDA